ncbi:MAG TPA: aminoglycoside phosphotransferase family protein [Actinomycetes bacterium]|nr:aminoglycoside phosphotransferase family protein [Actinomycetes bacterium]
MASDVTTTAGALPLAAGVRIRWTELPESVRAWVESTLGAPVDSAVNQVGGFSPGVAARLTTADGSRAFLKAVGVELNPDSVGLHRRELAAMSALPAMPQAPALVAGYDSGDWVGLLMEDIPGRKPALPWIRSELRQVLDTVADVSDQLTPSPWPDAPVTVDYLTRAFVHWRTLAAEPPSDLDPFWLARLGELAVLEQDAAQVVRGDSLIHLDVRADNVLLTERDGAVLVDWAWASTGAPWVDVVLLLLNVALYGPHSVAELDEIVADHPLSRDIDPWLITLVVLGMTGLLESRSRDEPPPGLPTIRAWQRHAARGAGRWLRHRLAAGTG